MALAPNLDGPALPPPDKVKPHFDASEGYHALGYAITTVGIVISTFSIAVHITSRAMLRKFGIVDLFIFAAWVCDFPIARVLCPYQPE